MLPFSLAFAVSGFSLRQHSRHGSPPLTPRCASVCLGRALDYGHLGRACVLSPGLTGLRRTPCGCGSFTGRPVFMGLSRSAQHLLLGFSYAWTHHAGLASRHSRFAPFHRPSLARNVGHWTLAQDAGTLPVWTPDLDAVAVRSLSFLRAAKPFTASLPGRSLPGRRINSRRTCVWLSLFRLVSLTQVHRTRLIITAQDSCWFSKHYCIPSSDKISGRWTVPPLIFCWRSLVP